MTTCKRHNCLRSHAKLDTRLGCANPWSRSMEAHRFEKLHNFDGAGPGGAKGDR